MTTGTAAEGRGESGYVLLALLAASAVIVAALALSLPRMALQSQRDKEQRLIEQGEQYRRAIELYYREHNRYPEELEDLEETDGVRYLRRRYKDPMGATGEWRIIHMGTDGRFEDSLLHDTQKEETRAGRGVVGGISASTDGREPGALSHSGAGGLLGPGLTGQGGTQIEGAALGPQPLVGAARARMSRTSAAPDVAARERYSEGFAFTTSEAPVDGAADGQPMDRSRMLPSTLPMDENELTAPAGFGPDGLPAASADPMWSSVPGFPSAPDQMGSQPAGPNIGETGNHEGLAAGSGATQMIHQLLTTPRSADQNGLGGQAPAPAQQVFPRGIAGVASKSEELGIKVYNGKQAFSEWEFVFDYRKVGGTAGQSRQGEQAEGTRSLPETWQGPDAGRVSSRTGSRSRR